MEIIINEELGKSVELSLSKNSVIYYKNRVFNSVLSAITYDFLKNEDLKAELLADDSSFSNNFYSKYKYSDVFSNTITLLEIVETLISALTTIYSQNYELTKNLVSLVNEGDSVIYVINNNLYKDTIINSANLVGIILYQIRMKGTEFPKVYSGVISELSAKGVLNG